MTLLEQLESGELAGAQRLSLRCDLESIPESLYGLAPTLEILDLNGNQLSSLPEAFSQLQKLKILFLSQNLFTEFPKVLASLPDLTMVGFKANEISTLANNALPPKIRWLILTDNNITTLPDNIGRYTQLQKLMLAGNQITHLPESMADCANLELIRISANKLSHLPAWIFKLPKLSWLACAGNPYFDHTHSAAHELDDYAWEDLEFDELLGEGASGKIFKATHHPAKTEVAVKLFKGNVTSDGYPADEMQATIAAGEHPNLVKVCGSLNSHPEEKSGLVLSLIPKTYRNLGTPPDFDTCTRDTFPEATSFTMPQILRIAKSIASTCEHLHAKGVMHGDLYAHNILITEQGEPLLGDFGAASHYAHKLPETASAFEHLEVRAYGCLLQDLLDHCADSEHAAYQELRAIELDCMNTSPERRPIFSEILKYPLFVDDANLK